MPPKRFSYDSDVFAGLVSSRRVFVFLDFDGTLSPIAAYPYQARLPVAARRAVALLARRRDVKVAVISGRALADIREKVHIPGIWYAGNHGCEIYMNGRVRTAPVPVTARRAIQRVRTALAGTIATVPGVCIEDKGVVIAVHYRQVAPARVRGLMQALHGIVNGVLAGTTAIEVKEGKKVFEFFPRIDRDKGWAVAAMHAAWHAGTAAAVYIGDDITDEAAFAVLQGTGVTIRVGAPRAPTRADYFLEDPTAVRIFLTTVAGSRTGRHCRRNADKEGYGH